MRFSLLYFVLLECFVFSCLGQREFFSPGWASGDFSDDNNQTPPPNPTQSVTTSQTSWSNPSPSSSSASPSCSTTKCVSINNAPTACYRVRREWRTMPKQDRDLYLKALQESYDRGIYHQFEDVHLNNAPFSHGGSSFLPWHRAFVLEFENSLRAMGPEYSCITIPYWDWSQDSGDEQFSELFDDDAFGGVDFGGCISDGLFAGWNDSIGNCVQRQPSYFNSFWSPAQVQSLITQQPEYGAAVGFRAQFEAGAHSAPHVFIGGHMATHRSPADPIFMVHHSNVDRIWALWQDCYDYDKLSSSQLTDKQYNDLGNPQWQLDAPLPGFLSGRTYTPRSIFSIADNGYLYADTNWIQAQAFSQICSSFSWFRTDYNRKERVARSNIKINPARVNFSENTIQHVVKDFAALCLEKSNQAFLSTLENTGNLSLALQNSVEIECTLIKKRNGSGGGGGGWGRGGKVVEEDKMVEWIENNFLSESCLQGGCYHPCLPPEMNIREMVKRNLPSITRNSNF